MPQTEEFDRKKCKQLEELVSQGDGLLVPEDARESLRSAVSMDQDYFARTGDFYLVRYKDPEDGIVSIKLAVFREERVSKIYGLTDETIQKCLPGRAKRTTEFTICGSEITVPRYIVDEANKLIEIARADPYHRDTFGEIDTLSEILGQFGEKLKHAYEEFAAQICAGEPQDARKLTEKLVVAKCRALDIRDATPVGESAYDTFEQLIICERLLLE